MVLVVVYFKYDPTFIKVFGAFWIALTLPVLFLHIEYFLEDRSKEVVVSKKQLTVSKQNQTIVDKSFGETVCIEVSCSKNIKDFGLPQLPVESYYYLTFNFLDGSFFTCTSLIFSDVNDIRRVFKGVPIIYKCALYNDIKFKKATAS